MRPFRYVRPTSLDELVDVLVANGRDARLLAGGTDVIVRMQTGHTSPAVVVDLKRVEALSDRIAEIGGGLRIGARVTMTTVVNDPRCRQWFPALVEAAAVVGSIQIRNRATLAGNICNASPAADTAPPLLAYGATVGVIGPAGRRSVALTDFFVGPGRTVLAPGEIVEWIDLPRPAGPVGSAFGRVTRRYGVDLATINLCCVVGPTGDTRFAYGAVGPRPFLVHDASHLLTNPSASPAERAAAIGALVAQASPIDDVRGSRDYRLAMLTVMSRRALATALERQRAGGETS